MDRRKFLARAGGAVVGLGLGVPAVITLISPTLDQDKEPLWVRVGELDAFPLNTVTPALAEVPRDDWAQSLRKRLLYVRRGAEGEIDTFSRNCTDLSCPVHWDEGSRTFLCPCHGGIFDREGEPIAGPPNKALYRYVHRINGGFLEVDVNSVPPLT